jgi:uncharacterized protein
MTAPDLVLLFIAAAGAGAINAIAGGGTLVSFPVLLALGVPPIAANVTNAVALCPGYLGAVVSQWRNLRDQQRRLWVCVPAAVVGGLAGALILLNTRERVFQMLIPYMLLAGSLLLAIQDLVRRFAAERAQQHHRASLTWAAIAVLGAGVYGGFFSAGMSVIVLALLALTIDDSFTRINALKQVTAFSVSAAASICFLFSGQVEWLAAGIMAVGALLGGAIGGHIAGRLHPTFLRWTVVCAGMGLAAYYAMKP